MLKRAFRRYSEQVTGDVTMRRSQMFAGLKVPIGRRTHVAIVTLPHELSDADRTTREHGEQAAWPSPAESSLQRRPDLPVDDQIREMVEVGLLAIDDDQAGASLLRQSWEPRGRIDFE